MKDRNADPVNKCPFYSREYIYANNMEGNDDEFVEDDICNLPGNMGYCIFAGDNSTCEVFANYEEKD